MANTIKSIQGAPQNTTQTIVGGGEMGDLIRSFNWASTKLGPISEWSPSLRITVNLILQSPASIIMLWGREGTILYNNTYSLLAGQRHPFMLGTTYTESWPETSEFIGQIITECLQGKSVSYRKLPFTIYRNTEQEETWLDLDCSPIPGDNGLPAGTMIITSEITEKVKTDEALQEHELRLRGVFTQSLVGISECDTTGRFVLANDRFCEMVGRTSEELYQLRIQDITHPDDLPHNLVLFKEAIEKGTPFDLEKRYIKPDGTDIWVHNNVSLVKSADGKSSFLVAVCHDITNRKKAERYQKLFLDMSENSINFIRIASPEGKVMYLNPTGRKMMGLESDEEIKDTNVLDYFPEEDRAFALQVVLPSPTQPGNWKGELRFRNFKTKEIIQVAYNQFLVKDPETEEVLGIATVCPDITERKRAEEALRESEEHFRSLAEASGILIAQTDVEGNAIYFNKRWLDLTGRSMEELLNSGWSDFLHPEDRAGIMQDYQKAIENREVLRREFRLLNKAGEYRWQLAVVTPRFKANHTFAGYVSSCIDVTESKQAQQALAESENRFKTFANNIRNLAWMANPDGLVTWYNQRWYDFTGTSFEEMEGWGWSKILHPDHVDRVMSSVEAAWDKNETWELIYPLKRADGEYRWFLTRAVAVKETAGNVACWIGTNTDITEWKQAEEDLQRRNEELQRTNNDLDNFIYTASHDLKAPITNIEGLVNTLVMDLPPEIVADPDISPIIPMIRGSIGRFKNTINDLTELTKLQRKVEEDISLVYFEEVLEEICEDLETQIQLSGATLEADFSTCPSLRFSKKNLRSVLYNLVSNAIKYASPQRPPLIRITSGEEQGFCVLTVQDNGLGIDPSQHNKIFTMFKRLHDHVEGTGIGLYIIKKIIDNSGGKITVESEVGKGSTFNVTFKL